VVAENDLGGVCPVQLEVAGLRPCVYVGYFYVASVHVTGRIHQVGVVSVLHKTVARLNGMMLMLCRLMYWVGGRDTIFVANSDGTQRRVFRRVPGARFDGMVLDARRDRLTNLLPVRFDAGWSRTRTPFRIGRINKPC